LGLVLKINEN